MATMLAEHVSYCRIADRLIFLDVGKDRYFAMRWPDPVSLDAGFPPAMTATLMAQGLLVDAPAGRTAARPASRRPPTSSLLDSAEPGPARGIAMRSLAAALGARAALQSRPLIDILAAVRRQRSTIDPRATPGRDLPQLANGFAAARRWWPAQGRCLPDSLALMRVLMAFGHRPSLVFGVIAYPFAAHCWVQSGDMVLNDALDHVTRFTPILVV